MWVEKGACLVFSILCICIYIFAICNTLFFLMSKKRKIAINWTGPYLDWTFCSDLCSYRTSLARLWKHYYQTIFIRFPFFSPKMGIMLNRLSHFCIMVIFCFSQKQFQFLWYSEHHHILKISKSPPYLWEYFIQVQPYKRNMDANGLVAWWIRTRLNVYTWRGPNSNNFH